MRAWQRRGRSEMISPRPPRALDPLEIDILKEVLRYKPDTARDAYREFIGKKAEGKSSEYNLIHLFHRLVRVSYINQREGRRGRKLWAISPRGRYAIKRARPCIPE